MALPKAGLAREQLAGAQGHEFENPALPNQGVSELSATGST